MFEAYGSAANDRLRLVIALILPGAACGGVEDPTVLEISNLDANFAEARSSRLEILSGKTSHLKVHGFA